MELGAVVCTARSPACLICPLAGVCQARRWGLVDSIPVPAARPAVLEVAEVGLVVVRGSRWLLLRRGPGRLWEGFWELPILHRAGADPAGRGVGGGADPERWADGFAALTGVRVDVGPEIATTRYSVTRHRVTLTVRAGRFLRGRPRPGPAHDAAAWVEPAQFDSMVLAAAMRRLIQRLLARR
ncbi:MAG: hypothetical protein KatS3mg108_0497 [Isosphaeraceae bacterium]|nr:MAG: hypothetical protein KatS3mg108_0497 [Isosphaeraceae bacterium]